MEIYVDGNNLPTELTTPIVLNEGEDNETIVFNTFELNKTGFDYLDKINNLNRILQILSMLNKQLKRQMLT